MVTSSSNIIFVDYHTHTTFSCDARHTVDAMCRRAIEIGLDEIAFTEHADFEHLDSCRGYLDPAKYFQAVTEARERYGDHLTIRAGVEIGEPHRYPDQTAELLDAFPFDFVLGSLHWVDGYPGFSSKFFEGRPADDAWRSYFEELIRLCEAGDFDVLAHPDLPKRHATAFDPEPYADLIRTALRHLINRDLGIEINGSGLRYPIQEALPGERVVQWFRELGGEVLTIGTDAHETSHLGRGFDRAMHTARQAGFDALTLFESRRPRSSPLKTQNF